MAREYQEALDRFEQALAIDRIYRPKAAVEDLENLASIYDALGDHAHALESRQKALEMKRERSESQQ
jgi:tetratricopeptide (TPR) repeat protein